MWRRLDCVIAIELKDLSDLFKMAEFIKAKYSKTLTDDRALPDHWSPTPRLDFW